MARAPSGRTTLAGSERHRATAYRAANLGIGTGRAGEAEGTALVHDDMIPLRSDVRASPGRSVADDISLSLH